AAATAPSVLIAPRRETRVTSDPFGDDQLRLGGRPAKRAGIGVLGRRPPRLRLLHARELDDDEALRRPRAFHRVGLAAADDETAAVLLDARRHHRLVVLVSRRVLHVHLHDDIGSHGQRSEGDVPVDAAAGGRTTRLSMKNSIIRCWFTFECPWSGPTWTSKLLPACCSALMSCREFDGCTLLSAVP